MNACREHGTLRTQYERIVHEFVFHCTSAEEMDSAITTGEKS